MHAKYGWALVAPTILFAIFMLSPVAGYADNPTVLLGKTIHLHYKKIRRVTSPGLFVPTKSVEATSQRYQLRIQDNGDIHPINISSVEGAFNRQPNFIFKIGEDVNLLNRPERVNQELLKNKDFSYWIVGASFQRNILVTTNRARYRDKSNGTEAIVDVTFTIAVSPDAKKCEIKSISEKSSILTALSKSVYETAMQYQMSCRIRGALDIEEVD